MFFSCYTSEIYRGDAVRISEKIPYTFDEVWVGVKKHPHRTKKITTFRDKNGKILERAFDFSDGYYRNRLYSYAENNITGNETVTSTTVKDFKLKKKMYFAYEDILDDYKDMDVPKTVLWTPIRIITNHLAKIKNKNEKILSQCKISHMETPTKEIHTITEFPHIIAGKIQKCKNKYLRYVVNSLKNKLIEGSQSAWGVRIPRNDSFLFLRALDIESAKSPMAEKFLKDKKLLGLGVKIWPNYKPKPEEVRTSAIFYGKDGSIRFNKEHTHSSKSKLAKTSGHETEHVYHWFLYSRYTGGFTPWQIDIAQIFGEIKSQKLLKIAKKCTNAIKNYVSFYENHEKYLNNYIEKEGRKAGIKAEKQYDNQGKTIRKDFPHIPKELL